MKEKMNNANTLVITGAGVSVESGIKPFRGKDGIWEENPVEMATFRKFSSDPAGFLTWYYKRFTSCLAAKPNETHSILAGNNIKVITQNIDGLHRAADHPIGNLIEIHGCIHEKRPILAEEWEELIPAEWDKVDENNLVDSLFSLFKIPSNSSIDPETSLRPHILLFDEMYGELYEFEKAMDWVIKADTIIFMGTSNSVGFTDSTLNISCRMGKEIIVVDPNPAKSFEQRGVKIVKQSSSDFCKDYFK
jgi:NAD-dependent deacetylase